MISGACLGAAALVHASGAAAHSFGQSYVLPVPFWLYAWAAAATLVVSFVIVGVFMTKSRVARPAAAAAARTYTLPTRVVRVLRALSVAGLVLTLATGLFGTPNAYANFSMTFFWIVFVLAFAYLTALIGDLYALINPWRVLAEWLERIAPGFTAGRRRYPTRLAYWPALALFAAFIAFELLGRPRPFSLALALSAYTLLNLAAVALVGAADWFRYGEFFSVFLRLIARLAPIEFLAGADGRPAAKFRLRAPLSGLLGRPRDHFTLLIFALFMLSATAFDGLHAARLWARLFWIDLYTQVLTPWLGANPYEAYPVLAKIYPWWQIGWLLASPFVYLAAYLAAIGLMDRLTRRRHGVGPLAAAFLHSLLPIVLVYHVTHYYTLIQVQGLKIFALVSDPFGFRWNLFGTARWFRDPIVPEMNVVWHLQVGLILAGHVASVVVAHVEALRIFGDRRTAVLSQLPLLALMVAFTVAGLWILSLPLGSEPR